MQRGDVNTRAPGRPTMLRARALSSLTPLCLSASLFLPSLSLCLSATCHPHASIRPWLPCLWAGSTEIHDGGAGAARRRRRSGTAATRERCDGGEGAAQLWRVHIPYRCEGRAGRAWAAQCVRSCWCSDIDNCQTASHEALRAGAGRCTGAECDKPFACAYTLLVGFAFGCLVARTLALLLGVCSGATCGKRILSRGLGNQRMNSRSRREIKQDIIM